MPLTHSDQIRPRSLHPGDSLRVGFLLDTAPIAAWTAALIEDVLAVAASVVCCVVFAEPERNRQLPLAKRVARAVRRRQNLGWRYLQVDSKWRNRKPDPFSKVDPAPILAGIPRLTVEPIRSRFKDALRDQDLAQLEALDLDVLIRLGFRVLTGKILSLPRFGVWSLHHGDNRVNRGGPPCFWEVFMNQPVTGALLQILNEDLDGGTVLARTYTATQFGSVAVNRFHHFWKVARLVPRELERLSSEGSHAYFERVKQRAHPSFYSCPLYRMPKDEVMIGLLAGHLGRLVRQRLSNIGRRNRWHLLYATGPAPVTSMRRFKRLVPPAGSFWADPFVVSHEGRVYVFFEEYMAADRKGHISVATIGSNGEMNVRKRVLEQQYHLSYPFVFRHGADWFMVPESAATRSIDLYRCTRFPDRWEFCAHLMKEIEAYDATLLKHNDRWWLFAAVVEREGISSYDELFLFHASDLFSGEWTPHPLNPIVSDARRARPAGPIFRYGARLYRPGQDARFRYGYGVRIHEVVILNQRQYEEREVGRIEPTWARDIVGVHHLSFVDGLTCVDAQVREFGRSLV